MGPPTDQVGVARSSDPGPSDGQEGGLDPVAHLQPAEPCSAPRRMHRSRRRPWLHRGERARDPTAARRGDHQMPHFGNGSSSGPGRCRSGRCRSGPGRGAAVPRLSMAPLRSIATMLPPLPRSSPASPACPVAVPCAPCSGAPPRPAPSRERLCSAGEPHQSGHGRQQREDGDGGRAAAVRSQNPGITRLATAPHPPTTSL